MKPDWTIIESVLDEILQLPEADRVSFINKEYADQPELREELLTMLKSIEHSSGLFEDVDVTRETLFNDITTQPQKPVYRDNLIGTKIGKYRIIRLISNGGMGSVYYAKRDDGIFVKSVALKLIRHGMDTPKNIARFEKERDILAGLNHPNIAGLIDGGVTDFGLPYLVMDYVDGKPIDEYADEQRLTIRERIKLFITICNVVQYAHSNMVIHRDLKPANILVDAGGEVKILDFGIAKLIEDGISRSEDETLQTQLVLTPNYSSPEQVLGKPVTTAADTYALGSLLCRLLTGCPPLSLMGMSLAEQQQVIAGRTPLPPSQLYAGLSKSEKEEAARLRSSQPAKIASQLRRDVDAIILKALRKESDARYPTAISLAEDLDRYLSNKPVKAHDGNLRYLTGKLIRRNYKLLSVAAAVLIMAVSFSAWHTAVIKEERNIAQSEAHKAAQVSSLLFELFEASEPGEALGDTITAHELLQRGLQRAELLDEQPLLKARMYNVIGRVYFKLGNYTEARPLLEEAIALNHQLHGPDHPETALSQAALGALSGAQGDFYTAAGLLNRSLESFRKERVTDYSSLASIKSDLAYIMRRQGKFQEADQLFRRTYEMLLSNYGPSNIQTINIYHSLGSNLFNMGFYDEAEAIYREVLSMRRQALGEFHPDLAISKNSLAALLMLLGRFDESEPLFTEAYNIRMKNLGADHPRTLLTKNNLAILNRDRGNFSEAEILFNEVLESRVQNLGELHSSTAISRFALGELYLMKDHPDDALEQFKLARPVFESSFSGSHSFNLRTKMNIGYAFLLGNEPSRAGEFMPESYDQLVHVHRTGSVERAIADHQMALYKYYIGEKEESLALFEKALNMFRQLERSPTSRQQHALRDLIRVEGSESDLAQRMQF
jgi:eukaryotic-like serine/threonine-protein kinase